MKIAASLLAAIIPMTLYLLLIWRMDKYEREPLKNLLFHFLWGAVGAVGFALLGNAFLSTQLSNIIADVKTVSLLEAILIAPFVEEFTKGLFLFASVTSRKFDNLTDGLVYGGAIGLGFGMTENFLYFWAYGTSLESWILLVLIRSSFSAVMHCMSTATLGAFLSIAKFSSGIRKYILPVVGLLLAMIIHFLWNFSVSFESTFLFGLLFIVVIVFIFILIFLVSLKKERSILISQLSEEVSMGIIPERYLPYLTSRNRKVKGWISEDIRVDLLKASSKMAFRKTQFLSSGVKNKIFYYDEVEKFRKIVIELLKKNNKE